MHIRQLMSQYIKVIRPDVCVTEAAQKMSRGDVGPLPVWDGERLVGILTDRDIFMRVVATERDPQTTQVREVMTLEVVSCFEDEEVETAARLMATHQIRRLPVLDREQHLVGILSLGDLAVYAADAALASEVLEEVSGPPLVEQEGSLFLPQAKKGETP
jgi:CBS domain-containing protein